MNMERSDVPSNAMNSHIFFHSIFLYNNIQFFTVFCCLFALFSFHSFFPPQSWSSCGETDRVWDCWIFKIMHRAISSSQRGPLFVVISRKFSFIFDSLFAKSDWSWKGYTWFFWHKTAHFFLTLRQRLEFYIQCGASSSSIGAVVGFV